MDSGLAGQADVALPPVYLTCNHYQIINEISNELPKKTVHRLTLILSYYLISDYTISGLLYACTTSLDCTAFRQLSLTDRVEALLLLVNAFSSTNRPHSSLSYPFVHIVRSSAYVWCVPFNGYGPHEAHDL